MENDIFPELIHCGKNEKESKRFGRLKQKGKTHELYATCLYSNSRFKKLTRNRSNESLVAQNIQPKDTPQKLATEKHQSKCTIVVRAHLS